MLHSHVKRRHRTLNCIELGVPGYSLSVSNGPDPIIIIIKSPSNHLPRVYTYHTFLPKITLHAVSARLDRCSTILETSGDRCIDGGHEVFFWYRLGVCFSSRASYELFVCTRGGRGHSLGHLLLGVMPQRPSSGEMAVSFGGALKTESALHHPPCSMQRSVQVIS
jgi:hypothetical protein